MRDEPLAAAHLAQAMLAAGMLQETDWQGELRPSMQAGIERWLSGLLGSGFKKLHLGFSYSNKVENLGLEATGWHEHHKLPPQPVGALALVANGFEWTTVSERVKELEALRSGIGYTCLRLLDLALNTTIGACTPRWAYGEICDNLVYEGQEEYRAEIEANPDMSAADKAEELAGLVTEENFLRDIPKEAVLWGKKSLHATLHPPVVGGQPPDAELAQTITVAHHLAQLLCRVLKDQPRDLCERPFFGGFDDYSTVRTVGVQWCRDDMVGRVTDDFHQQMTDSGEESHLLLIQGFTLGEPPRSSGSLQAAMAKIVEVLEILVAADVLLWHLNGDDRLQAKRARVRVRV